MLHRMDGSSQVLKDAVVARENSDGSSTFISLNITLQCRSCNYSNTRYAFCCYFCQRKFEDWEVIQVTDFPDEWLHLEEHGNRPDAPDNDAGAGAGAGGGLTELLMRLQEHEPQLVVDIAHECELRTLSRLHCTCKVFRRVVAAVAEQLPENLGLTGRLLRDMQALKLHENGLNLCAFHLIFGGHFAGRHPGAPAVVLVALLHRRERLHRILGLQGLKSRVWYEVWMPERFPQPPGAEPTTAADCVLKLMGGARALPAGDDVRRRGVSMLLRMAGDCSRRLHELAGNDPDGPELDGRGMKLGGHNFNGLGMGKALEEAIAMVRGCWIEEVSGMDGWQKSKVRSPPPPAMMAVREVCLCTACLHTAFWSTAWYQKSCTSSSSSCTSSSRTATNATGAPSGMRAP